VDGWPLLVLSPGIILIGCASLWPLTREAERRARESMNIVGTERS
jgi:hypothetical protein